MHYVGIDLANRTSAVCVVDERGNVVRQDGIKTDRSDLEALMNRLDYGRVLVEASPLAEWVAETVETCGHEAEIVEPRAAKKLAEVQKKTDPRDARTLAQLARSGFYTAVHRKSERARLQRSQIQARQGLVDTERAMTNRIRGLLRAHGIVLGQVSKGQFVEKARTKARDYVPELLPFLEPLFAILEGARESAKQLKKGIENQQKQDSVAMRLQTVPGVGPLVTQTFQATLDDPDRFSNGDEVADYLGLSPGIYQSGEMEARGAITKAGDNLVRWHLVEAAHVLLYLGPDCALKRWGQRLAENKGSGKARVAMARKLAVLLWRLWRKGDTFQPFPQTQAA